MDLVRPDPTVGLSLQFVKRKVSDWVQQEHLAKNYVVAGRATPCVDICMSWN